MLIDCPFGSMKIFSSSSTLKDKRLWIYELYFSRWLRNRLCPQHNWHSGWRKSSGQKYSCSRRDIVLSHISYIANTNISSGATVHTEEGGRKRWSNDFGCTFGGAIHQFGQEGSTSGWMHQRIDRGILQQRRMIFRFVLFSLPFTAGHKIGYGYIWIIGQCDNNNAGTGKSRSVGCHWSIIEERHRYCTRSLDG